jgi:hypothetical protein
MPNKPGSDSDGAAPVPATEHPLRKTIRALRRRIRNRPVRWGSLRRTSPVSPVFGLDRGTPVDRYYIERFLTSHRSLIRGRVLEIGDATYTRRFGGDRVRESHVLHAVEGNPEATLVGSLESGEGIPVSTFDCIVLTQTLHVIFDVRNALVTTRRALCPGGILLATVPGISQISRYDMDRWGDYWRFTSLALGRLLDEVFGTGTSGIESFGNVLAATALLHGIAADELTAGELDHRDPDYELVLGCVVRNEDRA